MTEIQEGSKVDRVEVDQAWLDRAWRLVGDIEESHAERRRMEDADPKYQPPQFGTIDSSAYVLNLQACLGQCVPHLLRIIDALSSEDATRPTGDKE